MSYDIQWFHGVFFMGHLEALFTVIWENKCDSLTSAFNGVNEITESSHEGWERALCCTVCGVWLWTGRSVESCDSSWWFVNELGKMPVIQCRCRGSECRWLTLLLVWRVSEVTGWWSCITMMLITTQLIGSTWWGYLLGIVFFLALPHLL